MNQSFNKSLGELAELVGGQVAGDASIRITGVSGLESAEEGDIVFVEKDRQVPSAVHSAASAVIAPKNALLHDKPAIVTDNPRYAFARILQFFSHRPSPSGRIDESVQMGVDVVLGQEVSIGPLTVLGDHVKVGGGTCIGPLCWIGDGVTLGENCTIHAHVILEHEVTVGNNVILHGGCVIGTDGFGYFRLDGRHEKMPQVGVVVIEADVEIGANTTIDRGTIGATRIGQGTKIDNLVQIAHNVQVGKHCIICAQTGISGSTQIGDGVVLGGQVGIGDHITIGSGTVVGAQGGVIGDLPAGSFVSGYPAGPHREKMKVEAAIRRVPELLKRVRDLTREVEEMSKALEERRKL